MHILLFGLGHLGPSPLHLSPYNLPVLHRCLFPSTFRSSCILSVHLCLGFSMVSCSPFNYSVDYLPLCPNQLSLFFIALTVPLNSVVHGSFVFVCFHTTLPLFDLVNLTNDSSQIRQSSFRFVFVFYFRCYCPCLAITEPYTERSRVSKNVYT